VFAHSVLPRASLRGRLSRGITQLGTKPLGEGAVFRSAYPRLRAWTMRRLDARDPLYRAGRSLQRAYRASFVGTPLVFLPQWSPAAGDEVFLPAIDANITLPNVCPSTKN